MNNLKKLVSKFHPIFWFYTNEPYYPCSIKDYIDNCSLIYNNEKIVKYKNLTPSKIVDPSINTLLGPPYTKNPNFILFLENPQTKKGDKLYIQGKGISHGFNYPVQIFVYVNKISINQQNYIDLIFIIPFAYNGTSDPHDFDAENVTVRIKTDTESLIDVYLSQHSGGKWVGDTIEYKDGHSIVYVAGESHALYSKQGKHKRLYNFGTDFCNKGQIWSPQEYNILPEKMEDLPDNLKFLAYVGRRSIDSGQSFPPYQQPGKTKSTNYECPTNADVIIEKTLGPDLFNNILMYLNITAIVLMALAIFLTLISLKLETYWIQNTTVIISILCYIFSVLLFSVLFMFGYSIIDFDVSLSGTS
jgi:hypothetical protein